METNVQRIAIMHINLNQIIKEHTQTHTNVHLCPPAGRHILKYTKILMLFSVLKRYKNINNYY